MALFSGSWDDPGVTFFGGGSGGGIGGACVNSGHAAAFLARTTGLDVTHVNAYTALLDGLDADALSCKLDMLHIYATQNSTTALLNLMSNKYNGTAFGALSFVADRGFTGTHFSTTKYIDTGFNTFTAVSPFYTGGSNHISAWSVTNDGDLGTLMGAETTISGANGTNIDPTNGSNIAHFRTQSFNSLTASSSNVQGQFLASRTDDATISGYRNATLLGSVASASSPFFNLNFAVCAENDDGVFNGSGHQVAMASIGAGLTSTEITNFYTRLRTYMTAVGVP